MNDDEVRLDVHSDSSLLVAGVLLVIAALQLLANKASAAAWLIAFIVAGVVIALALERRTVTITAAGVFCERHFGRLVWRRRYATPPPEDIKVEVFAFDSWDPHLAIHCGADVIRIAWGMPEAVLHELRDRIRRVVGGELRA